MNNQNREALIEHFCYPEQQLLAKLAELALQPEKILVLGLQQQFLLRELQAQYPNAEIFTDDCNQTSYGFDLIIDSQAMNSDFFVDARRLLAKQGVFATTMLGPNTLIELRHTWQQVDSLAHVNTFSDMHDIGDQLRDLHFANITLERQDVHYQFEDVYQILYTLKSLGSTNEQGSQFVSRDNFEKLNQSYPRGGNKCDVSVEVIYVIAHQAENLELTYADSNGVATFHVEQLRQSR